MAELLPCPFCGGKAHIEQYMQPKGEWRIMCMDCPTKFGRYAGLNKKEVIKAWNTRILKETHEKHTETHDNTSKERGADE